MQTDSEKELKKIFDTVISSGPDMTFVTDARAKMLVNVCKEVIAKKVEGAFVETGVYLGGMVILMAAVNKYFDGNRKIYAFDSYEGCPSVENLKYQYHTKEYKGGEYSGVLDAVKENFKRVGLLDDNIKFVKGWFVDTLIPTNIPEKISVLRFDADYYSSTLEVLEALYDRVSIGGYIIIDDYCLKPCREAVHEFLKKNNIDAVLCSPYSVKGENIYQSPNVADGPCGVYWKKK